MGTRYITVRAKNATEAKKFGKDYAKLGTATYYAERVTSAKLDKRAGCAAGIPGYTVGLSRRKIRK